MTADDRAYLENFLRSVERDTTAEVVVVTVSSLDGMTIEEYANRLFADWGIGTKARDNGVLLLVAPADRQVRIEVGYGLKGSLPDGLAGEIIRTAIVPEFKQGNMRRGIGRGLDRISRVVRSEVVTVAPAPTTDAGSGVPLVFVIVPFFSLFVGLGGIAAGLGLRTRTISVLIAGGLFTAIPLLLAGMASPESLAVLLPLDFLAMVFGYRKGGSESWARAIRADSTPVTRDDGWVVGGTTSGASSSSDSSSSSDFGGGSSGGGGASGSW